MHPRILFVLCIRLFPFIVIWPRRLAVRGGTGAVQAPVILHLLLLVRLGWFVAIVAVFVSILRSGMIVISVIIIVVVVVRIVRKGSSSFPLLALAHTVCVSQILSILVLSFFLSILFLSILFLSILFLLPLFVTPLIASPAGPIPDQAQAIYLL
jgi:hypothetical protein